ncbi:hypothetical protein [Lacisediminihabitans sp. H27-G8]|uniref:hypothetical protein n=1 Tax=Lacisediminihabitans sp. H27-G8 TaxID=3111909 RepID=UPI0038FD3D95
MNATVEPVTGVNDQVPPSAVTNTIAPEVEFRVTVPAPPALAIHLFAAGIEVLPATWDIELNTAVNGTTELTPGNVIAFVDTSRFPVPTSTAADTWSLIGNDRCVAEGRAPVIPTTVGAGSGDADADNGIAPTRPTARTAETEVAKSPRVREERFETATTDSTSDDTDNTDKINAADRNSRKGR